MGIDRESLRQLEHVIRPIASRLRNIVAKGVVQLVNDARKLQVMQLGVQADEDVPDCQHHQAYGFSSVPLPGAEAVVLFPSGDRERPLVVAVSDRRYRPRSGQPGEVTVYNNTGAKITMTKDGDIVVEPAAGREMLVRAPSGTAVSLATKADVDALAAYVAKQFATTGTGHTHTLESGGVVTLTTAPTATPGTGSGAPAAAGTSVLKGE